MTDTTMTTTDKIIKIIKEDIIRKTRRGMITHIVFLENSVVKSEYRLFDNRGTLLQTIKTPFRVAEYL